MSDVFSKLTRWRATASTWAMKAQALMHELARTEHDATRYVVGYEAERLASDLLAVADLLVPLLNDDDDADIAQLRVDAQRIDRALRAKARAPKLAATSGRTPAEAALFEAKAREVRGGGS